jgi:protein involved in sex pheromone biosynthesis
MTPDFKRYNEDIEKYNEAAVRIVTKHGFKVNDLYDFSKTLPMESRSDAVHFYTETGEAAFTRKVLDCIQNEI